MVKAEMMAQADLIVVMHQGQKEALQAEFPECRGRIALLGELAGERALEIPDPANTRFTDSEGVARLIVRWTEKGFGEIVKKAANRPEGRPG
jgi:protein-tyrosine-phosphatase